MRHHIAQIVALTCAATMLAGCDADRPLALAAGGASLASATGAESFKLTATAVSPSQVDLEWVDNSTNESGYEIHRSTTGSGGTFTLVTQTSANVTTFSNGGLSPSTEYCYKVRAFRTNGSNTRYSEFSDIACARTKLDPPSNTNATPDSSTAAAVTWAHSSGTADGFRVERSASNAGPWELAASVGGTVGSYRDPGRPSEQVACYRLIASNAHGDSGPSNADCTTPPAGPSNLVAAAVDQGIALAWTDNSAVEDGYVVERAADGVTFSGVADLPANSMSYRDTWVSSTTTYWYRVLAKADGGFSDLSNVASAAGGCEATGSTDVCNNGRDDDCDGVLDSDDPDCAGCPQFETDCANGIDDDCDSMNDDVDPDCNPGGCGEACPPGQYCIDDVCVSHCHDGVRNGDESDIDCGGSCGATCEAGQSCNGSFDCKSNSCVSGVCQAPKR
jgi:hypothetical protein